MVRGRPLGDRRLLGTWKSDCRKTLRHFVPSPNATRTSQRRLKSIFGKLVVRYAKHRFFAEYDGSVDSTRYEVVTTDASSVVIRVFRNDSEVNPYGQLGRRLMLDLFPNKEELVQIHFEEKWYWIWTYGHFLREYFRRVD